MFRAIFRFLAQVFNTLHVSTKNVVWLYCVRLKIIEKARLVKIVWVFVIERVSNKMRTTYIITILNVWNEIFKSLWVENKKEIKNDFPLNCNENMTIDPILVTKFQ